MLKDSSILYVRGNDGINGLPLVWVIDGQCVYDIPTWEVYKEMFTSSDKVMDVSSLYPDHDGITVRFIKNDSVIEELQTTEYFGSILLSDPTVLDLRDYAYGRHVISPNAAFDGEKFIITNMDMSELTPWAPTQPQYTDPDIV